MTLIKDIKIWADVLEEASVYINCLSRANIIFSGGHCVNVRSEKHFVYGEVFHGLLLIVGRFSGKIHNVDFYHWIRFLAPKTYM